MRVKAISEVSTSATETLGETAVGGELLTEDRPTAGGPSQ